MTDRCDHAIDVGAYVLGALGDHEAETFVAHLAECEVCPAEVRYLQVAVDAIPVGVPQLAPPPELKSRIMDVVNREAQLLRAAGPEADRVPAPAPEKKGRFGWLTLRPALAGALATAVLALAVGAGVLVSQDDGPVTRTIQAQVTGPGRAEVRLTGDKAELQVRNLPSLDKGRVYQVWLLKAGGAPKPTHALFSVRPDGRANVKVDESVAGYDQLLVSVEPDGGSEAPTSTPLIAASTA